MIALFIDNVERSRPGFQDNPKTEWYGSHWTTAKAGHNYHAVVRWYGIYGNNEVGSHENAESRVINFGEIGFEFLPDTPDTPDVSGISVPVPVAVPVEYEIPLS